MSSPDGITDLMLAFLVLAPHAVTAHVLPPDVLAWKIMLHDTDDTRIRNPKIG